MPTGFSAARWKNMPATTDQPEQRPLWSRLLWFVTLWAGSVAAVGLVGLLIRFVLRG
ncbi:DUF2474 domain-containing protein [uncultured Ferrovibrio sp.]|uniref:DUF2474 domain-containing protein n=1 Tax=uncultured Ferrovibrio sp. TaxID=1576913 RepID=UPI0034212190